MSTYIGLQERVYEVGNRQWLLAEPDYKANVTLDITKFNATGTSEVQTATVTGSPTGGTFTLTYAGQTTAAIAFNATAATVQLALQALTNIGTGYEGLATTSGYTTFPGAVAVTGSAGGPYTITFQGALATTKVATMTATSSLTGGSSPGVTIAVGTAGVTAHYPNGYIPSGCAIAQVTATGLYGPYDATQSNGQQTVFGFTYADVRAVWLNNTVAAEVGTGAVVYNAVISKQFLPFQGGPGSIDAAGITALTTIRFQA
jgi:hypothetical protein